MTAALSPDRSSYESHWLHTDQSDWPETNCYADVWIELLHVLGHDPLPALGFTLRTDLESDQWTFYKFRHHDLEALYGLEVIELNPWTTVLDQVASEVKIGRPVLVEVDAWFLPDTAATSYQTKHVKTTIAVLEVNVDAERLVYAHNRSVHVVTAHDFRGVFALDAPAVLPPYIESVRLDRMANASAIDIASQVSFATAALRSHLRAAPAINPFERYVDKFALDLARMANRGVDFFHDYAFSSYRQFGSAFFLAAVHLDWLRHNGSMLDEHRLSEASVAFRSISGSARALQMRSARTAVTGKVIDASATLQSLVDNYHVGVQALRVAAGMH
jgi:hypothetical protein